jgi:hypothetical protein
MDVLGIQKFAKLLLVKVA